jgi:hypothetical protein
VPRRTVGSSKIFAIFELFVNCAPKGAPSCRRVVVPSCHAPKAP